MYSKVSYLEGVYNETRGRKPIYYNEGLDPTVEQFISWVEGRYIPNSIEEEDKLYSYGERCYPYLMELYNVRDNY